MQVFYSGLSAANAGVFIGVSTVDAGVFLGLSAVKCRCFALFSGCWTLKEKMRIFTFRNEKYSVHHMNINSPQLAPFHRLFDYSGTERSGCVAQRLARSMFVCARAYVCVQVYMHVCMLNIFVCMNV
jgi:hypothetical protein